MIRRLGASTATPAPSPISTWPTLTTLIGECLAVCSPECVDAAPLLSFSLSRETPILGFGHDAQVLPPVVCRVPILVVDVLAVTLPRLPRLGHLSAGGVPLSPALLLLGLLMICLVLSLIVSSGHSYNDAGLCVGGQAVAAFG